MRVLRRIGDDLKWSAKLVSEYDVDDKHHKDAMTAFANDIFELTGIRNCYLDRETLLKMYDQYMGYKPSTPMWGGGFQAKRAAAKNNWRCSHGWLRGEQCEICNAPKREWVGLTDEEINAMDAGATLNSSFYAGALWAEAKLKEKNNG